MMMIINKVIDDKNIYRLNVTQITVIYNKKKRLVEPANNRNYVDTFLIAD